MPKQERTTSEDMVLRRSRFETITGVVILLFCCLAVGLLGSTLLRIGMAVLGTVLTGLVLIDLRNNRLQVQGQRVKVYNWRGQIKHEFGFDEIQSVTYDNPQDEPIRIRVFTPQGSVSVRSYVGYQAFLKAVQKARPDLSIPAAALG